MALTDIKTDDAETAKILAAAYLASLWTEGNRTDQRTESFLALFERLYQGMDTATKPGA
ncbi:MAG: hypothetical protein U5Q44_07475 [Dehalococcoidia bacterium]|nr:hypothetical protein [Dehalococcoidia bacterium]